MWVSISDLNHNGGFGRTLQRQANCSLWENIEDSFFNCQITNTVLQYTEKSNPKLKTTFRKNKADSF